MPGSSTTPGRPSACVGALGRVAFRYTDSVGTRNQFSIAAQWLACTYPCQRFADILAGACARLGADVVRYTFIVMDLHLLLLAGLPAHRIIAFITAAPTVRDILVHLGEPTAPPRIAPARGPPLWETAGAEHELTPDPALPPTPAYEFDQRIAW